MKSHILLIESDKILASNVSKALKKVGYLVDWQVDPQFALDSADSKLPDVIILDLVLANHGGTEFLYEFRSYPDWQVVPVVLFSSLSPEELKAILNGFDHLNIFAYHYKPTTSLKQLAESVGKAIHAVAA